MSEQPNHQLINDSTKNDAMTNDELKQSEQNTAPAQDKKTIRGKLIFLVFFAVIVAVGLWLAYRPQPEQIQGMVDADSINIATKVPSRVEQLLVREGDHVHQGQVLAVLTSPEVEAKQQQAQASLQSAQAMLQTTERGPQEENVASLKANWQASVAQANLAKVSYQRAQNLYDQGVISRQRRDEAFASQQSSAEMSESSRQQYLKAARGSTPEQLSSAHAHVAIAQAGVQEANSLKKEMQLIAPTDGEVDKKFPQVGELVATGIPVYTLIDMAHPWVTINLREDQFHHIKDGQTLLGDIPALDLKQQAFKVSHIAAEGSFATWKATRQSSGYDMRTFEIKLTPTPLPSGLRPGMSVLFAWPQ